MDLVAGCLFDIIRTPMRYQAGCSPRKKISSVADSQTFRVAIFFKIETGRRFSGAEVTAEMSKRRGFNISSRIFVLLSLIIVLMLGGGATTIWYAREFNELNTTVIETEMAAFRAAGEL